MDVEVEEQIEEAKVEILLENNSGQGIQAVLELPQLARQQSIGNQQLPELSGNELQVPRPLP